MNLEGEPVNAPNRGPGRPPKVAPEKPKEPYLQERLLILAAAMANQTSVAMDRQRFLNLLDYIQSDHRPLPQFRVDGRSPNPNRIAIIYNWMLWIITQCRPSGRSESPGPMIEKALALAEKAAGCFTPGKDFEITGSVAEGWTLEVKD
jgi:hypothetical protein